MAKRTFRVLIGMNYPPDDRRAEPGEIVDDIPAASVDWLLREGAIEPVNGKGKAAEPKEEGG